MSFAFKQGGFTLNGNVFTINRIGKRFRFSYSREYKGNVKMVRIKCSHLGEYYLYVITNNKPTSYGKSHNGATIGIDFGLKTYMTLSNGEHIDNPQFLRHLLKDVRKESRRLSKCQKGSGHREQSRLSYCRLQERLVNRRNDYKNDKLTLKDCEWLRPQCGQIHDRDVNAAKNILRKGISELVSNGKTYKSNDLW